MAEISEIVSQKAIESIGNADKAIKSFDENMQKSLTALVSYAKELKEAGLSFKDLNAISQKMASTQQKTNDTQKQAEKIIRETEKATKAQEAVTAKLIAKEKEHNAALQLEVKTIKDAQTQNRALTVERNKAVTTYGKQSQAVKDLNAKLTQNTEFMRANGTAADKQRMNIGNYGSATAGLSKAIGAIAVAWGSLTFFKDSFKAYEEQEKANRRLLNSLKGNTQAYGELVKQANKLQSQTGVADDAIMQIQQLGASAGFSTGMIKKITAATVELSAKTGDDLQTTYEQLAKSLTGVGRSLKVLGPDFANLTAEQLKSGAAIDLINEKFTGFAANSASQTDIMAANWDEFKEAVGGSLSFVNGILKETTGLLVIMNEKQGLFAKLGVLFNPASAKAENAAMQDINRQIDEKNKKLLESMPLYKQTQDAAKKQLLAEANLAELKAKTAATIEANKDKPIKAIEKQITEYDKLSTHISDLRAKITELKLAGKPVSAGLIRDLVGSEAQLAQVKKEVDEIANSIMVSAMASKGITGAIPTSGTNGVLTPRSVDFNAANNKGTSGAFSDMSDSEKKDFAIESAQITSDAIFAIVNNSQNAEFDLKMSNLEKEKNAKLSNAKLTEAQKAKIEADYAKKTAKLKTEQFKKEKAASIVQAIINTAIAIAKVAGNPGQVILAGLVGAAQVAVIASQKVPQFDKGTMSAPSQFIAGENAPEFVGRSGNWQLITKPTHFKNYAGATVISSKETKQMIEQGMSPEQHTQIDIRPNIELLRTDIKNMPRWHISPDGYPVKVENGFAKTYMNKPRQWAGKAN